MAMCPQRHLIMKGKNGFFDALERAYDISPRNRIKVVLGDFSVQVGKEAVIFPTSGSWTTNPQLLACGIVTAQTEVPQHHCRQLKYVIKWTGKQRVNMFLETGTVEHFCVCFRFYQVQVQSSLQQPVPLCSRSWRKSWFIHTPSHRLSCRAFCPP
jgi:hypothetical protein